MAVPGTFLTAGAVSLATGGPCARELDGALNFASPPKPPAAPQAPAPRAFGATPRRRDGYHSVANEGAAGPAGRARCGRVGRGGWFGLAS